MEKKFYCNICGEDSCLLIVKNSNNLPFACPFDKKHNAVWKKSKTEKSSILLKKESKEKF